MKFSLPDLRFASVRIAAAVIGSAFLVLTAQAIDPNPLVGTPFNATINFHTPSSTTLLGIQSGIVGSGPGAYEVAVAVPNNFNGLVNSYGSIYIDLNPDAFAHITSTVNYLFAYDLGLYTSNWVTIHMDFPSLTALGFSSFDHPVHDSTNGYSALSVGSAPNSLDFVYAGNFIDLQAPNKVDWWGYAMVANSGGTPGSGAGAGIAAVPEPSTYGLLGSLALLGVSTLRKRKQKPAGAVSA